MRSSHPKDDDSLMTQLPNGSESESNVMKVANSMFTPTKISDDIRWRGGRGAHAQYHQCPDLSDDVLGRSCFNFAGDDSVAKSSACGSEDIHINCK